MASSFTALKIKEIHSGVIHKVGGRVKTWHKRWLILKSDYTLQYFKDPSKAPLGSISITDASFSIERGQDGGYTGWPKTCSLENTMIITTSGRIYYMYTDSLSETEEWIRVIEQQRQNIEKSSKCAFIGEGGICVRVCFYTYLYSYFYKIIAMVGLLIIIFTTIHYFHILCTQTACINAPHQCIC